MPFVEDAQRVADKVSFWWYWGGWLVWIFVIFIALWIGCSILWFAFRYVVRQAHVSVHLRRQKILKSGIEPGWYWKVPFLDEVMSVFIGVTPMEIEEEVRTNDNSIVCVTGAVHWRILKEKAEHVLFQVGVEKLPGMIEAVVLSHLRSAAMEHTAQDISAHKDEMAQRIMTGAAERVAELGAVIDDVPITQVEPHESVAKAMLSVQEAERSSEAAKKRAEGTKTTIVAEAEGRKQAAELQGRGEAAKLEAEAQGYLRMARTLIGDMEYKFEPRAALAFILRMRDFAMKTAFAASAKSSAVVLPDDPKTISEIAELVPALVAHESIEGGNAAEVDKATIEELEAEFKENLTDEIREAGESALAQIRAMGEDLSQAAIETLPKPLRGLAQRMMKKHGRKS